MSKLIVVDSSVFLSVLLLEEPIYHKVRKLSQELRNIGAIIAAPTFLYPEVIGAIMRRQGLRGKDLALMFIRNVDRAIREGIYQLFPLNIQRAKLASQISIETRLKGADATFVALAKELDSEFYTRDREIKQKADKIIKIILID